MLNIPRLDPPLLLLEKVLGLEKDLSVDNMGLFGFRGLFELENPNAGLF